VPAAGQALEKWKVNTKICIHLLDLEYNRREWVQPRPRPLSLCDSMSEQEPGATQVWEGEF
jgi:hypothetical protein